MAAPFCALMVSSLLSLVLLLLLPSPSTANEGNILVTGDILPTDGQLSLPNAVLVIQNDCNLVLYNKGAGFQSGTSGLGINCTLTLSEFGQLIIKNGDGSVVWSSPYTRPKGEYAVILQPDGHLGFYGPVLWSTPLLSSANSNIAAAEVEKLRSAPIMPNLMFSSDVLQTESKLVSRDYALEVNKNCSLQFTKASVGVVWESPSYSSGRKCFARLNFHGQLVLADDNLKVMWGSEAAEVEGIYALVVKINGQATIYGYRFWSTVLAI